MRIKAIVSYKGTRFFGYQIQANENEISVQEEIQKVLSKIFSTSIKIVSSGRTDRGVHAINQCFHFDFDRASFDLGKLKHSLDCLLPSDIYIKSLEEVDESFHARFSVVDKTYRYIINVGEYNPLIDDLVYNFNRKLDLDKMKEGAKKFIGEHSFHNFCSNDEDFVRNIHFLEIKEEGNNVIIDINGNGFRRYMVRMIVGTLIAVGSDKLDPFKIDELLDTKVNDRVSYKAPSQGLYLFDINYGGKEND